ncbi:MAG: ABC transporter permease [Fibrobacterota bacterium]
MNTIKTFFERLGPEMAAHTAEHLGLVLSAMFFSLIIALPIGVFLAKTRRKRLVSFILGAAGVIQTVPSLALISLIVVVFAFLGLPTIGFFPAVTALVLYSLLPIMRNTYTGINQVAPSIVEVATGMGMKPGQILLKIELPLSIPVIMAGIRISTVWTIGVATLVGLIGAGGLGNLIIRGLRSFHMDYILAGTLPAAALALVFDAVLSAVEKALTPPGIK